MATFRTDLANESHWLQPVLVLTIRWWSALVSVGGLLETMPMVEAYLSLSQLKDNTHGYEVVLIRK